MEDDRKLCEYSLPEGTTISALFEPDVDINIEVSTHHQKQKLTVSNATSVMELKVRISGVMKCGMVPEKLEIRLGDVTLEDPMPLHYYRVKDGSRLDVVKPYVGIRVKNNKENTIYWRLNRKDAIGEVKVRLATSSKGACINRGFPDPDDSIKVDQLRLYLMSDDGQTFDELGENDEIVDGCKIRDDDKLYLLSYMWTQKLKVTVKKTGRELWGLEKDDTCLGVKVKAQDQTSAPVSTIRLVRLVENEWVERHIGKRYNHWYKQLIEISDNEFPFIFSEPLSIVTEEELKEDVARVEAERDAWLEEVAKKEEERKTEEEKRKREEEEERRKRRGYRY